MPELPIKASPGWVRASSVKLGLAYRNPDNDRWNALLRYEHRLNPNTIPINASSGSSTDTQEHLLSAEAIYAPDWRWGAIRQIRAA